MVQHEDPFHKRKGLKEVWEELGGSGMVPSGREMLKFVHEQTGLSNYRDYPLDRQLPGVDTDSIWTQNAYSTPSTEITTLPNGLTVVSRDTHNPICNVGMLVKCGSRHLSKETSGFGSFLEAIAFQGSTSRSTFATVRDIYCSGLNLSCQAFRDCIIYQGEGFRADAKFTLELLADLTQNPRLESAYIAAARQEYLYRRGDAMGDSEQEFPEIVHQAAFAGNTLGNPLNCDHHSIENMTPEFLRDAFDEFYQPSRLIITATGVDHQSAVDWSTEYFGHIADSSEIKTEPARYTGGEVRVQRDFNDDFTHVGLSFQTEGWLSEDLMALCTLNMMMGGGGTFSAGGPGKGMYSRLYREVLGRTPYINNATCTNYTYDDVGLLTLYGNCQPSYTGKLVEDLTYQAKQMADRKPDEVELQRSKNALACNICFEFENRQVVYEDMARQVASYGTHHSPEEYWTEKIQKVTAEDIQNVAAKMLKSKPSLVVAGRDFSSLADYDQVRKSLGQITA